MAGFTLRGAVTALVTPFSTDGCAIDWDAFEQHVEAQIQGGIQGLVPCGTTGESPTLTDVEHRDLIARTVHIARGRVPVLAGAGSNSTAKSVELAKAAVAAGADAVMVVMPYYNKPSQEGLLRHVGAVASAIDAPVVVYNVPSRTVVDLTADTTLRILDLYPNVVGVKDASGNCCYCQELLRRAGDRVFVLSGDDPLTLPLLAVGAVGVISVTSNLYPGQVNAVIEAFATGRIAEARARNFALFPVHRALFMEPSPAPTKAALDIQGRMNATVRPPLVEATEACRQHLLGVFLRPHEAT
jgi:4-hydroxy-tetrahydrodipicolinate synthase